MALGALTRQHLVSPGPHERVGMAMGHYGGNQISTTSGGSAGWRSARTRWGSSWAWISARVSATSK